jgi:hypothetical protein
MSFLDALFSGAKALAKELVKAGGTLVREILREIDNSSFGKAATRVVSGMADRMFSQAQNLADEERELAEKYRRDGRRSEADEERIRELKEDRDRLRAEMDANSAARAAQEFKERADEVDIHQLDDDEISANVGILAAKNCPNCGGAMRVIQGAFNTTRNERNFWWQCTAIRRFPCPNITIHANQLQEVVVRPESADFDTPKELRRETWGSQPVINETHARVRQHLEEADKQIVCPDHLLPLKLIQCRRGGKLLDSYEYVCMAINADGTACDHTIPLQTMPQVAAMLERNEGKGIIR